MTTQKEFPAVSIPSPDALRSQIVRIVLDSAEGDLTGEQLTAAGDSLAAVSYSSLSYIRMIDAIENELGVYLDPEEENEHFETVDGIVKLVSEQLQESASV
ncbi:hypothetical protein ACPXCE_05510 [Streptomyces sp. DT24]|uniref:hypothetical protein n=1 Tax=unclassified Streptomyces TaxID=2593676 RepID=UPI003CF66AB9